LDPTELGSHDAPDNLCVCLSGGEAEPFRSASATTGDTRAP